MEDPSGECGGEGSVASSSMTNLHSSPSEFSRNDVWNVEGGSALCYTCWFGDMVSTSPPRFSDYRAQTPPKLKSNGTIDEVNNTSS